MKKLTSRFTVVFTNLPSVAVDPKVSTPNKKGEIYSFGKGEFYVQGEECEDFLANFPDGLSEAKLAKLILTYLESGGVID